MRVLLVNKYAYVRGGADRHCAMLADGLAARGHEVMMLATQAEWNGPHAGAFVPKAAGAKLATRALWNRPAAAATRAAIDRFRPDLIHGHMLYPYLSVAPLVVARRRGVPVVHTLHTYELLSAHYSSEDGGWIDRSDPRMKQRLVNTATAPVRKLLHPALVDEYIAVSDFVAQAHARRGIAAHVVPSAIDATGTVPGFDERSGVAFAGRLVEEKGVRDAIEVARRLPGVPVTVYGAGPLASLVREAASELVNLTFAGWVKPELMPERLRRARVLLMPSRCAETSGLAALEALACGTPVVASAVGGLEELVRDSGGGRVVAGGAEQLARACEELCRERAAWEALSTQALDSVRHRFSTSAWLDGIESVYERAVASRCRPRRENGPYRGRALNGSGTPQRSKIRA